MFIRSVSYDDKIVYLKLFFISFKRQTDFHIF